MLRTNNKKVKKYFDDYLSDIIEDSFDCSTENMVEQFFASASDSRQKLDRNYKTFQDAFVVMSMNYGECYYDDMRSTLKEALEETEEEANKYNNDKVAMLYNSLLYSAYLRRCEKEKIYPFKGFKY